MTGSKLWSARLAAICFASSARLLKSVLPKFTGLPAIESDEARHGRGETHQRGQELDLGDTDGRRGPAAGRAQGHGHAARARSRILVDRSAAGERPQQARAARASGRRAGRSRPCATAG